METQSFPPLPSLLTDQGTWNIAHDKDGKISLADRKTIGISIEQFQKIFLTSPSGFEEIATRLQRCAENEKEPHITCFNTKGRLNRWTFGLAGKIVKLLSEKIFKNIFVKIQGSTQELVGASDLQKVLLRERQSFIDTEIQKHCDGFITYFYTDIDPEVSINNLLYIIQGNENEKTYAKKTFLLQAFQRLLKITPQQLERQEKRDEMLLKLYKLMESDILKEEITAYFEKSLKDQELYQNFTKQLPSFNQKKP